MWGKRGGYCNPVPSIDVNCTWDTPCIILEQKHWWGVCGRWWGVGGEDSHKCHESFKADHHCRSVNDAFVATIHPF